MNETQHTDAELLARTARGDDAAFGVLVRRHIRAATLLAAQLLGDRDEAEDIVQHAFTIVLRDSRRFDDRRPFPPWLFAIVRRLASNRQRRNARRERLLRIWRAHVAEEASPPVEDSVLARLAGEAAHRAMKDLSPMQRACFELVAIRGISIREVAAMHDISESTVRQHVFRARAALRVLLENNVPEKG